MLKSIRSPADHSVIESLETWWLSTNCSCKLWNFKPFGWVETPTKDEKAQKVYKHVSNLIQNTCAKKTLQNLALSCGQPLLLQLQNTNSTVQFIGIALYIRYRFAIYFSDTWTHIQYRSCYWSLPVIATPTTSGTQERYKIGVLANWVTRRKLPSSFPTALDPVFATSEAVYKNWRS